jgi:hypothetical protein
MILTPNHLAVIQAALEFWDDEMSPHDPGISTAYFQRPIGDGQWIKAAVSFFRSQLPVCELRYALLTSDGITLASDQSYGTPEVAQAVIADPFHRIGTFIIGPGQS